MYAIGNNEEDCRYSGLAVDHLKIIIFTLSGLMSAIAGTILISRFGSVHSNIAPGFDLEVTTAVLLGGVDIFEGHR